MAETPPVWLTALAQEVEDEWADIVDGLDWARPPRSVWEPPVRPGSAGTWCSGGAIDVVWNLVGRHAETDRDRVAIRWEGEPGDQHTLTYAQLSAHVAHAARALRRLGVESGDVVALHTGWLPESVVTMLACTSVGASWSMLPVSLPAEALGTRIEQLSPTVLLTQDGAWRRGAVLPLKNRADEALASTTGVEATVVIRRTGMDVAWFHGDHWFTDLAADAADAPAEPAAVLSPDHILCTRQQASGAPTTRVTEHTVAGVLLQAAAFHRAARTGPVLWCAADVSWAVSTWHGLLGPLLHGDTAVVYEGTLDVPDHFRTLDIAERHGVSTLVTTPSVTRTLRSWEIDDSIAARGAGLQHLVTAGEPVEQPLRDWMDRAFAAAGCAVSDGWGQVDLNGIVSVAGRTTRLDSARLTALGADRRPVGPGQTGDLVLRLPTPGSLNLAEQLRAAWDHEAVDGLVETEDIITVDADGRLLFHSRADDVVSVSGQLISLRAVAQALEEHPYVRAATALRAHRENYGSTIIACVVPAAEPDAQPGAALAADLVAAVNAELGGLARPRLIVFLDRMEPGIDRPSLADALLSLVRPRATWASLAWDDVIAVAPAARRR